MPDDTVTTSWKRFTDKVKTACGESVHASLPEASRTSLRQGSHADSSGLESDAAGLATWEDEGGTTALV